MATWLTPPRRGPRLALNQGLAQSTRSSRLAESLDNLLRVAPAPSMQASAPGNPKLVLATEVKMNPIGLQHII